MPNFVINGVLGGDTLGNFGPQEVAKAAAEPMNGDSDSALRHFELRGRVAIRPRVIVIDHMGPELLEQVRLASFAQLALQAGEDSIENGTGPLAVVQRLRCDLVPGLEAILLLARLERKGRKRPASLQRSRAVPFVGDKVLE